VTLITICAAIVLSIKRCDELVAHPVRPSGARDEPIRGPEHVPSARAARSIIDGRQHAGNGVGPDTPRAHAIRNWARQIARFNSPARIAPRRTPYLSHNNNGEALCFLTSLSRRGSARLWLFTLLSDVPFSYRLLGGIYIGPTSLSGVCCLTS